MGELLVAGYQKYLENDLWGLTNSTQEVKALANRYGQHGLELEAHSRGSMTVGNAMESLSATDVVLSNIGVNFYGPAYNAEQAAKLLYELSGGRQDQVNLQNHRDDFVGRVIGGNPSTFDQRPKESNKVKEWVNMFSNGATVHSCYGVGKEGCDAYGAAHTMSVKVRSK